LSSTLAALLAAILSANYYSFGVNFIYFSLSLLAFLEVASKVIFNAAVFASKAAS
jgi:hypothetical protein